MLNRITVVGSGSWATALVKIFTESLVNVSWLVRDAELAGYLSTYGSNPRYLSSVTLNRELIIPVANMEAAFRDTELIIFAVPSAHLQQTIKEVLKHKDSLRKTSIAVSIKGMIPGEGLTPAGFVAKALGRQQREIIVIGGPCHAEEIACEKTTFLTIAGVDIDIAGKIHKSITCPYIKPVLSDDPIGVEYASVLKNIIGIASGIASGLLYGYNFQAVLIANAMKEAKDYLQAIAPGSRNLFRSVYFGDLLVTAYSDFSRNRTLGKLVGRGLQVNKALQVMEMVAEGFHASGELGPSMQKAKAHLPVLQSVYRILHKHTSPYREFKLLEEQFT